MKVELTENIREVIDDCAKRWDDEYDTDDASKKPNCDYCPLLGACVEYFTGDDSANQ